MTRTVECQDPKRLYYALLGVQQKPAEDRTVEALAVRIRSLVCMCMSALEVPTVPLSDLHLEVHGEPLRAGEATDGGGL